MYIAFSSDMGLFGRASVPTRKAEPGGAGGPRQTTDAPREPLNGGYMRLLSMLLLVLFTTTLTGCELIGNIFQAGIWVGVIAVLAVLGLVAFLFSRTRR
jgi:hypothetical protein